MIVDDRLPVDKRGKPLCSFSNAGNELWVSIIEKAYMKVNGGYDFPGSNSGIDLYCLTGWIPEHFRFDADDFNKDVSRRLHSSVACAFALACSLCSVWRPRHSPLPAPRRACVAVAQRTWERLKSGNDHGDVLITIATGKMSEAEEEKWGLVQTYGCT